jgi:hypothetical protein
LELNKQRAEEEKLSGTVAEKNVKKGLAKKGRPKRQHENMPDLFPKQRDATV